MKTSIRWTLVALLMVGSLTAAIAYEKRINCGGYSPVAGPGGQTYEADVEYNGSSVLAGYVGGWGSNNSDPKIGWRDSKPPYDTKRSGSFEYRFDLPNGDYLVTLGFSEWSVHGPDIRVFDIFLEGNEVLANMDIIGQTGARSGISRRMSSLFAGYARACSISSSVNGSSFLMRDSGRAIRPTACRCAARRRLRIVPSSRRRLRAISSQ